MDNLLKRRYLEFSIDQIIPVNTLADYFAVTIIPEMHSKADIPYFAPLHLRTINVRADLLKNEFYNAVVRNMETYDNPDRMVPEKFQESVLQGAYYKVLSEKIPTNVFSPETIIDVNNDFFMGAITESPHVYPLEQQEIMDLKIGVDKMSNNGDEIVDALYIYGLNVGQGDSLLMICPNGSVYLIDTNYYWNNNKDKALHEINAILKQHGLPEKKIKAMLITHKHIDHIRGAAALLKEFEVDYFLINHDYDHHTRAVYTLLETAASYVPNWININGHAHIHEGKVNIYIQNPDNDTRTTAGAPDINDSSIILEISYLGNSAFLTGDAGSRIIYSAFKIAQPFLFPYKCKNFLKVSHHGSVTGTNKMVLSTLNPGKCFISVGNNKRYKHPDAQVVAELKSFCGPGNTKITKSLRRTVEYKFDYNGITVRP